MRYFSYTESYNPKFMYDVFQTLQGLESYARIIYGSGWSDAIGRAYSHILKHYDEEKGSDLGNYATRVVKLIDLGKNRREFAGGDIVALMSETETVLGAPSSEPHEILEKAEDDAVRMDVQRCISDLMADYVIGDFKFFVTKKPSDYRLNYDPVFRKYGPETIVTAVQVIRDSVIPQLVAMQEGFDASRSVGGDPFKRNLDTSIEYEGMLNGVVLYRRVVENCNRFFYSLDLAKVVNYLFRAIYLDSDKMKVSWESFVVYLTPLGAFTLDEKDLFAALENCVIGSLFLKMPYLKAVSYSRGDSILLSAVRFLEDIPPIELFGVSMLLPLISVTSKRV